jgi:hypothetical protein
MVPDPPVPAGNEVSDARVAALLETVNPPAPEVRFTATLA